MVYPKVIERYVNEQLPFMATEAILMAGVQAGGDRQDLHERIRQHSMDVTQEMREGTIVSNDLLDRIAADPAFVSVKDNFGSLTASERFIGRSPQQVEMYIEKFVEPIRQRYAEHLGQTAELNV